MHFRIKTFFHLTGLGDMNHTKTYLRYLFIAVLGFSGVSLHAQLLWKISGKGLAEPSYLFGTHHMIPIAFLDSVPGLFKAFNQCDAVVGEMVLNNIDASEKIMEASMLPQGLTIDSLLNEQDYTLVDMELKSMFKIGLKELALMKPAVIRTMYETELYRKYTRFSDDIQSDSYFQQVAEQKNKKIIGLEDIDTQIALLFGNTDQKREALLLVETLLHKEESIREIETLNSLYKAGEIDKLVELAKVQGDPLSMTHEEYNQLIDSRNQNWVEQLPEYMHGQACFIAVGAMHLGGENGLIHLLRKEGYKVKRVK